MAIEFDDADLNQVRELALKDTRSVGFMVRRAVHYWLETSPDVRALAAIPSVETKDGKQ